MNMCGRTERPDIGTGGMGESGRDRGGKILLVAVNASFIHSNPAIYALRRSAYAALGEDCPDISLAEYTINDRYEDILYGIIGHHADVIGISVYIWNAGICLALLADLRRLYPKGTKILFSGGPEAETRQDQYLEYCDFVMCGEGERAFTAFCRRMAAKTGPGECTRGTGTGADPGKGICGTGTGADPGKDICGAGNTSGSEEGCACPEDLLFEKELPFLYDGTEDFAHRIIYYESSRGCPFRCTYCLSSKDKRVVFRNIRIVKEELTYFLKKEAAMVKFVDRTFNANASRAREIWQFLKEHDNGVTCFHFEIGADLLREEDLALLKSLRPGLVQLEIGIQSTNPRTLEAIRRTADNEAIFRSVRELVKNQNMALHTDLIAGLPFEGVDSFRRSFNEVYALRAHQFQVGFLKVLAGTQMERQAEEYGILSSSRPPYTVLATKWLRPEEIDRLRRIADMVDLFWNAGLFRHALPYLERGFSDPFSMYDALAEYYEEKMGNRALSPRARGAFLLAFADDVVKCAEAENPGFARDIFAEWLRYDERLHFHSSRRMKAEDTFALPELAGKTLIFDYARIHPVTKEAAVTAAVEGKEMLKRQMPDNP